RGLPDVERRRVEGEARDRTLGERIPAGAPLAAEQRQERETVRVRVTVCERPLGVLQRVPDPPVEIAAVGERTALDDAPVVEQVEEEPRLRLRLLGLVDDTQRSRGADAQRGALAAGAAGADVGARAVDPRGEPAVDRL